jgi:single-strand DNA-binding protein
MNRSWKSETGEEKEEVCYVTVTVWGKQAETAGKYLKKGRPLFVEGRLQYETWEKNGEKRSTLKVLCERFQFLNSGGSRDSETGPEEESAAPAMATSSAPRSSPQPDLEDDDIPF